MASVQISRGHLVGVAAGTIVFTNPDGSTLAGTISYNRRSLRVAHNIEVERVSDEDGDVVGLCAGGEFLEGAFTFIPYGTSIANATASHSVPFPLARAAISGFPVFPMGNFADALNTNSGSTQPWIYEGGAEANFDAGVGPSSYSITLRRYPSITSGTAIS